MLKVNGIHHIAIICSDYQISKKFYMEVLGFEVEQEVFREARNSWKLDLKVAGKYQIELFSFPNPAPRPSRPEATGLRHMAFEVNDLDEAILFLSDKNVETEPVRVDEFTGRRFTFFADPGGLPLELYEV